VAAATGIGFVTATSATDTAVARAVTAGISFVASWSIMAGPSTMAMAATAGRGFAEKNLVAGTFNSCTAVDCTVGCFRTSYLVGSLVKQQTCL